MKGTISSKEKQILKKNPALAKQFKKMRKLQSDISKDLSKLKGADL